MDGGVKLKAQAVGQARKVIEDAHDVRDFQAGFVVEADRAERLPVLLGNLRGVPGELVCDRQEGPLSVGEIRQLAPAAILDGGGKSAVAAFGTQKLCVALRSVETVLCGRGGAGDHFPLTAREPALG